ncbi:phage-related protein [Paraburkholderia youngii]
MIGQIAIDLGKRKRGCKDFLMRKSGCRASFFQLPLNVTGILVADYESSKRNWKTGAS